MDLGFETLGNATLVFYDAERPVLATDPWVKGTCYFGSWGLDRPLTASELEAVVSAEYVWISHGHPDHLHWESLALLPRGQKILLPDHYSSEIAAGLCHEGFAVEVMQYRKWRRLSPRIRCMCLDNENQDAILIVEADDALVVNLNDSPLCGEKKFIRNLVKRYDRKKTYLAKLCAVDADMLNLIDARGKRVTGSPNELKPGMIWATARLADTLGVGSYVCSSSQHIYVRSDSVWANPYRVVWPDIQRHWSRPHIQTIEPFVKVDLISGSYERKHPTQSSDFGQITNNTAQDDYSERLEEQEWLQVTQFFSKFETIRDRFDHLDFVVGGERRRIWLEPAALGTPEDRLHGFGFHVPKRSLLETIKSGYFDDLLIGNFMKTELHNATLYPHFTPMVSKLGGNAKVFTHAQLRAFKKRYFWRNPFVYLQWSIEQKLDHLVDVTRWLAEIFGVKAPLKRLYRKIIGDPIL